MQIKDLLTKEDLAKIKEIDEKITKPNGWKGAGIIINNDDDKSNNKKM